MANHEHYRKLNAYWVIPEKLLAGAYPSDPFDPIAGRQMIRQLLDAGFTLFIDLTREDEYSSNSYWPVLQEEAERSGQKVRYLRQPIADMGVPTLAEMDQLLGRIDEAIAEGERIYLHCFGGRGRTGTVAGCYLVRHGQSGQEALEQISRSRQGLPNAMYASPETFEQKLFVLNWGLIDRV